MSERKSSRGISKITPPEQAGSHTDGPVQSTRIRPLNDRDIDRGGRYVLYWMQASQRESFNPALEYAIEQANRLGLGVVVCFGLMDDYPEANARHYAFMLEGLSDVAARLERRGIRFVVKHGHPQDVAVHYAKSAALVVADRAYLRHQKAWREHVASHAERCVIEVEGDVVVPVDVASNKHEFAARTIRPKIHRHWESYLVDLPPTRVKHPSLDLPVKGDIDVADPFKALARLKLDTSVGPVTRLRGGQTQAHQLIDHFVERLLDGYGERRNEPSAKGTSLMAAYLHFGMISPVELALRVRDARGTPADDRDTYLEELIVRRELSMNFCNFNPRYDQYACLPEWARKTLGEHAKDKRAHVYTREQLEAADTHDPYWNAAQLEMTRTGFMHNYMRMYWGKKILEWTADPAEAFATTLYLNNKYFLCGRDPNSYANVAWVYGLHDRPWGPERPIFGLVRYMNAAGLERKFDMDAYIKMVAMM